MFAGSVGGWATLRHQKAAKGPPFAANFDVAGTFTIDHRQHKPTSPCTRKLRYPCTYATGSMHVPERVSLPKATFKAREHAQECDSFSGADTYASRKRRECRSQKPVFRGGLVKKIFPDNILSDVRTISPSCCRYRPGENYRTPVRSLALLWYCCSLETRSSLLFRCCERKQAIILCTVTTQKAYPLVRISREMSEEACDNSLQQ